MTLSRKVMTAARPLAAARPRLAVKAATIQRAAGLATVVDANPVLRSRGLTDQDRIFTNANNYRDFSIKGAQVRSSIAGHFLRLCTTFRSLLRLQPSETPGTVDRGRRSPTTLVGRPCPAIDCWKRDKVCTRAIPRSDCTF